MDKILNTVMWEDNIKDARIVAIRIGSNRVELKLSTSHILSVETVTDHGEFQQLDVTSRPAWEDEWTFGV